MECWAGSQPHLHATFGTVPGRNFAHARQDKHQVADVQQYRCEQQDRGREPSCWTVPGSRTGGVLQDYTNWTDQGLPSSAPYFPFVLDRQDQHLQGLRHYQDHERRERGWLGGENHGAEAREREREKRKQREAWLGRWGPSSPVRYRREPAKRSLSNSSYRELEAWAARYSHSLPRKRRLEAGQWGWVSQETDRLPERGSWRNRGWVEPRSSVMHLAGGPSQPQEWGQWERRENQSVMSPRWPQLVLPVRQPSDTKENKSSFQKTTFSQPPGYIPPPPYTVPHSNSPVTQHAEKYTTKEATAPVYAGWEQEARRHTYSSLPAPRKMDYSVVDCTVERGGGGVLMNEEWKQRRWSNPGGPRQQAQAVTSPWTCSPAQPQDMPIQSDSLSPQLPSPEQPQMASLVETDSHSATTERKVGLKNRRGRETIFCLVSRMGGVAGLSSSPGEPLRPLSLPLFTPSPLTTESNSETVIIPRNLDEHGARTNLRTITVEVDSGVPLDSCVSAQTAASGRSNNIRPQLKGVPDWRKSEHVAAHKEELLRAIQSRPKLSGETDIHAPPSTMDSKVVLPEDTHVKALSPMSSRRDMQAPVSVRYPVWREPSSISTASYWKENREEDCPVKNLNGACTRNSPDVCSLPPDFEVRQMELKRDIEADGGSGLLVIDATCVVVRVEFICPPKIEHVQYLYTTSPSEQPEDQTSPIDCALIDNPVVQDSTPEENTDMSAQICSLLDIEEPETSFKEIDLQSDVQSDVHFDFQSDVQSYVQSDLQLDVQSDVQLDVQSDVQSDVHFDLQSDVQSDVHFDIQSDIKSNVQELVDDDQLTNSNTFLCETDLPQQTEEANQLPESFSSSRSIPENETLEERAERILGIPFQNSNILTEKGEEMPQLSKDENKKGSVEEPGSEAFPETEEDVFVTDADVTSDDQSSSHMLVKMKKETREEISGVSVLISSNCLPGIKVMSSPETECANEPLFDPCQEIGTFGDVFFPSISWCLNQPLNFLESASHSHSDASGPSNARPLSTSHLFLTSPCHLISSSPNNTDCLSPFDVVPLSPSDTPLAPDSPPTEHSDSFCPSQLLSPSPSVPPSPSSSPPPPPSVSPSPSSSPPPPPSVPPSPSSSPPPPSVPPSPSSLPPPTPLVPPSPSSSPPPPSVPPSPSSSPLPPPSVPPSPSSSPPPPSVPPSPSSLPPPTPSVPPSPSSSPPPPFSVPPSPSSSPPPPSVPPSPSSSKPLPASVSPSGSPSPSPSLPPSISPPPLDSSSRAWSQQILAETLTPVLSPYPQSLWDAVRCIRKHTAPDSENEEEEGWELWGAEGASDDGAALQEDFDLGLGEMFQSSDQPIQGKVSSSVKAANDFERANHKGPDMLETTSADVDQRSDLKSSGPAEDDTLSCSSTDSHGSGDTVVLGTPGDSDTETEEEAEYGSDIVTEKTDSHVGCSVTDGQAWSCTVGPKRYVVVDGEGELRHMSEPSSEDALSESQVTTQHVVETCVVDRQKAGEERYSEVEESRRLVNDTSEEAAGVVEDQGQHVTPDRLEERQSGPQLESCEAWPSTQ